MFRGFSALAMTGALALALIGCGNTTRTTETKEVQQPTPPEYMPTPIGHHPDYAPGAVTQYTNAETSNFGHPHVSYDGMWLAYASTANSENPQVYVQKKGKFAARQLTHGSASHVHPQISLDSRQIAFASNRDGKFRIYTMHLSGGGGLMEVSDPGYESLSPTWSPDGMKIAYMTRASEKNEWMIAVADLSSGATTYLTIGSYPDWSPDGSRLVFQRVNHTMPGYTSIFTCTPNGKMITKVYHSDTHGAITPCWAGNQWIVFATVNKSQASLMRMNEEFFNADDIWMVHADGTQARVVTAHRLADWDPCFDHARNEIVYVSNRNGVQNIYGAETHLERTWAESEDAGSRLFGGGR